MQKITSQSIQEILNKSDNLIETIKTIKLSLVSKGYNDYSSSDKLLLIKAKEGSSSTINIDLKKYTTSSKKTTQKSTSNSSYSKTNNVEIEEVSFMDTLTNKYAEFNGRAKRKEYWTFIIVSTLIWIIVLFIFQPLSNIVSLIFLLPHIAVSVRRIHDVGLSGWWGWIFMPLAIPMIIVGFMPTDALKSASKTINEGVKDFTSGKPKPKDMNEVADTLLKFKQLLDTGVISQEEFDYAKKDLLNKK